MALYPDQRGCGSSRPHASDPAVDLAANTTHHLLADIERYVSTSESKDGRVSEILVAATDRFRRTP